MPLRAAILILHRYAGLMMAAFLFVASITGSLIAFSEELDVWLNPDLHRTNNVGKPLAIEELIAIVERHEPQGKVWRVILPRAPGQTAVLEIRPRKSAEGRPAQLDNDEFYVDPVTGAILGQRLWDVFRLDRRHFVPFLYRLHDRLHLPGRWGRWLLGGIALVWVVDCFAGFYLTLPRRRAFSARWRRAWLIVTRGGSYRFTFDLHRAGGLWLWIVLLMFAVSSVSLNLRNELFRPAVSAVLPVTANIFDQRERGTNPPEPRLSFSAVAARANAEAVRLGWPTRAETVAYIAGYDVFAVRFRVQETFRDEWRWVHLDGQDGRFLEGEWLGRGKSGDIFVEVQFPLHSGRLLGLPGRILIAIAGLSVAALSVTGVLIWWKKRRNRARHKRQVCRQR